MTLEEGLLEYDIGGTDVGETLPIYLPHPFSYVILKLFALRDRAGEELKGPYHAFDIYRIIAMMTEEEWEQSVEMRDRLTGSDVLAGAKEIVQELFAGPESEGVRLLLNHARTRGRNWRRIEYGNLLMIHMNYYSPGVLGGSLQRGGVGVPPRTSVLGCTIVLLSKRAKRNNEK